MLISVVIDSILLTNNWGRIETWMAFLLILFGLGGVLIPWGLAISSHNRVYKSCKIENRGDSMTNGALDASLAAAATMTLDSLFVCFTTISFLLALLYKFINRI